MSGGSSTSKVLPLIFLGSEQVKGKKQKIYFFLVNWNKKEETELIRSWSVAAGVAPRRRRRSSTARRPPVGTNI